MTKKNSRVEHKETRMDAHEISRRVRMEESLLNRVAQGPFGRWLATASVLLSLEGCASLNRLGNRQPTYFDVALQHVEPLPTGPREPPMPESMRQAVAQMSTSFIGPLFAIQMPSQEWLNSVRRRTNGGVTNEDRFIMRIRQWDPETRREREISVLNMRQLPTRWWREMEPTRPYIGNDGRRYVLLQFNSSMRLPTQRDLGPFQEDWQDPRDPGLRTLQRMVERHSQGRLEVFLRHEEEPRENISPGYHELRFPTVYYLVRSRRPLT